MQINSVQFNDQASKPKDEFEGHGITRLVRVCSNEYETGYQRIRRVRANTDRVQNRARTFDQVLAHPEQFQSRTLRGLIHLSRYMEELGEATSDISGLTERAVRNLISSGEKNDMAKIIAAALGRVVSAQLNLFGVALHKVIGTACYGLSSILSVGVLAFATSRHAKLRSPEQIERSLLRGNNHHSGYLLVAKKLLGMKEQQLEKVLRKTSGKGSSKQYAIHRWAKRMSRNHGSVGEHLSSQRRTHSNYMLNNLHQYGAVTRGLMQFSYLTFQGVNKLFVSYDKHIGTALGRRIVGKHAGDMLGCRLALTATVGGAAALSIPMSPLIVGLSTAGAIACGVALTALLLAKANVYYFYDWKGDIVKT